MLRRNILIAGGIIAIVIAFGAWFYFQKPACSPPVSNAELEQFKVSRPEYAQFVDDIISWQGKVANDPNKIDNYFGLGLAWKSLADRTRDAEHYRSALAVYEQGIEKTIGKNTIFLTNAANMAIYLNDFFLAEKYFRDGIAVSSGDSDLYVRLAELYEYKMKKPKKQVVALFDEGLARVITGKAQLQQSKQEYLKRVEGR